jgi:predicted phosphodiesterase
VRLGVLSDIHANLHALEAVLEALEGEWVDEYLCMGDLVGYGPFPNECVAAVERLGIRCVAGNHDLIALEQLSDDGCVKLARDTLRWTRSVLSDDARRFLERLPRVAVMDVIVMAHGSLDDPTCYVRRPGDAAMQLDHLAREHPRAEVLLLGHTHSQIAVVEGGRVPRTRGGTVGIAGARRALLNPGSVGQSRERAARARFMVLDLERREATFHARRYDVQGCRRALRDAGLPTGAAHIKPAPFRTRAGALRRRLGRRSR